MFNKLFPLCYKYTRKLVDVEAVSQVDLLRDSSFDALYVRKSLSLLCMELMPFVGIVLNECLEDGLGLCR